MASDGDVQQLLTDMEQMCKRLEAFNRTDEKERAVLKAAVQDLARRAIEMDVMAKIQWRPWLLAQMFHITSRLLELCESVFDEAEMAALKNYLIQTHQDDSPPQMPASGNGNKDVGTWKTSDAVSPQTGTGETWINGSPSSDDTFQLEYSADHSDLLLDTACVPVTSDVAGTSAAIPDDSSNQIFYSCNVPNTSGNQAPFRDSVEVPEKADQIRKVREEEKEKKPLVQRGKKTSGKSKVKSKRGVRGSEKKRKSGSSSKKRKPRKDPSPKRDVRKQAVAADADQPGATVDTSEASTSKPNGLMGKCGLLRVSTVKSEDGNVVTDVDLGPTGAVVLLAMTALVAVCILKTSR